MRPFRSRIVPLKAQQAPLVAQISLPSVSNSLQKRLQVQSFSGKLMFVFCLTQSERTAPDPGDERLRARQPACAPCQSVTRSQTEFSVSYSKHKRDTRSARQTRSLVEHTGHAQPLNATAFLIDSSTIRKRRNSRRITRSQFLIDSKSTPLRNPIATEGVQTDS